MTHSELLRQQKIQLKILSDFDSFCKKQNIKYYIIYGTLLGAIRHKGFIPWDYDIDTVMTRSEYQKFMQVYNLLPSHLSIWEVCYSDINHAGLARIMYHDEALGGVHIDIFILDYAKEGWTKNKIVERVCGLLHFAKLSKNEKSILLKHFSGSPLKQMAIQIAKVVHILVGGSANAERLIYKMRVSKNPTKNYITLEDSIRLPVECFSNPQLLDFDGHLFYAPQNAEELLTTMYGNYMEIPPEGHKWLKEEGLE